MPKSEAGWLAPAVGIVVAVSLLRLALLAFNRTDLFVDESQYWLWGQEFAFGYYSKPPLIGWVIGVVTILSGSDSPFWVRAPGPVFHGATALILSAMAGHLHGRRVAIWVAASYVTLPMVAVGSLIISTDTIMAPFFAAALWAHMRLTETRALRFALMAGAMAGGAFLAKYAAVYFLLGVGLGALLLPGLRVGWRNAAAMLAAFGLVALPNILWNLRHGFATLSHTLDNVGWVREATPLTGLNPAGMAEFFLSQFGVFGPVLFAALIWATIRPGSTARLLVFSVPAIVLVTGQALLARSYANWAASAYFAGTIAAVVTLIARPRLLMLSLALNGVICLALPVLTLVPQARFGGGEPLLARYVGRADLSRQILAAADAQGGIPVVADRRDVLADLFHTGAGTGAAIYARRPAGRPLNHYEQSHAMPEGLTGRVLFVTDHAPDCPATPVPLDTDRGAYARQNLAGWLIDADCLDDRP